jgi:integrating conjugative element protein (TIGR03757 family)
MALPACIASACWHAALASDLDVRVYTDDLHPVASQPGITVKVFKLDETQRLLSNLSANLPTDPSQAAAIARQRLAQGGANWQARMQQASQGVADAWSLGIAKVPAVVVNGRYVVYGETDVGKALQLIEQYRRAHP